VIVRYIDVVGVTITPGEAYSILVIDPDAVLPMPVSLELLQSVAARDSEIVEISGSVQHREFSFRHAGGRRSSSFARSPDFRRFRGGETLDHVSMITTAVNNVKRYYIAIWCFERREPAPCYIPSLSDSTETLSLDRAGLADHAQLS